MLLPGLRGLTVEYRILGVLLWPFERLDSGFPQAVL
jgi:hypothetical protein